LQLVTQAWQPTQTLRSMTRASWVMTRELPRNHEAPLQTRGHRSPDFVASGQLIDAPRGTGCGQMQQSRETKQPF
jgi:hypothetical protein